MPFQCVDQGTQQRKDLTDPVGQARAFQYDAGAGIDLALTIQRKRPVRNTFRRGL
jgi:hypothetical protein